MTEPQKYRTTYVVTAMQWTGKNVAEIDAFIDDGEEAVEGHPIHLDVPGGDVVKVDDWVIQDERGDLHAVDADVFAATYEAVSE